jgi:hypothetical protein
MNHHRLSTHSLATATLAALATFPILVLVLHLIQRGSYDPVSMAVSELALGRAGWLMAVAFCAAAAGMFGFAVLLRRILPGSVAAPGLVILSGLCSAVSAFVHTDAETAPTSVHGEVHQAMGLASFALVVVAMFVCSVQFRRNAAWRRFALPTLGWALCTVGAFFLVPVLGSDRFGLAQRIFLAVWLSWPIAVAVLARRTAEPTGRPSAIESARGTARV